MFTEKERDYLASRVMLRLGTATPSGNPDVTPLNYRFDGEFFYVSGRVNSRRSKNLAKNPRVAFAVDDADEGKGTRGIRVRGVAEFVERDGRSVIRIRSSVHWSWGIHQPLFVDGKAVYDRTDDE